MITLTEYGGIEYARAEEKLEPCSKALADGSIDVCWITICIGSSLRESTGVIDTVGFVTIPAVPPLFTTDTAKVNGRRSMPGCWESSIRTARFDSSSSIGLMEGPRKRLRYRETKEMNNANAEITRVLESFAKPVHSKDICVDLAC